MVEVKNVRQLEMSIRCSYIKCPYFPKDFIIQCETDSVFVDVDSHHVLNNLNSNKLNIDKADPVGQHQNNLALESNVNYGKDSGSDSA